LAQKSFLMHPMELLGDVGHVESHFGPLEIVLVSVQDSSIVLILLQLAQKSFWMHPTELLCDVGHVESCFGLFGDCVNFGAR
jgi:hypothetical protein